jgi:hypothetical protein
MIRLHKDLTKPFFTDGNGMVVTGASGRKYAVTRASGPTLSVQ